MDPSTIAMHTGIVDDVLGQIQGVHSMVSGVHSQLQTTAANNAENSGGTVQAAFQEAAAHHIHKVAGNMGALQNAYTALSQARDGFIETDNLAGSQYNNIV